MPPDIFLLTIDALRADFLRSYGSEEASTPNLDAMADASVRFTQAITNGSWTQAALPPLLTSSYAGQYGGCMGALSPDRPSPVEVLRSAGYRTIAVSSNPWLSRRHAYDRGFDSFQDLAPEARAIRLRRMRGGQALLRRPLTHRLAALAGRRFAPPPVYVSAEKINRTLLRSVESTPGPVFAWAHYMDIHWPYHLESGLQRPEDIAQAWRDIAHFHDASWNSASVSAAQVDHYRGLYRKALAYLDSQIGRLLDSLEQLNRLQNAVVIVLADHGEEFLDHGLLGHLEVNFHEEILRVPFWIRLPGESSGWACGALVQLLDVMPTILDLCGCRPAVGMEGSSLIPLLKDHTAIAGREFVISERPRPGERMIAVRSERFKLVWREDAPGSLKLFDLQNDPSEKEDCSAAHPEIAGKLQAAVRAHLDMLAREPHASITGSEPVDERLAERLRDLGYLA